ncbi:hypothetical protein ACS0TY_005062 [Phlomoides rotata]
MEGGVAKVKEEKGLIELQIQYEEAGRSVHKLSFQTYRDLPLRRIFLDFCDSLDLVYKSITFWFDAKHVKETESADGVGLEDGDLIDAHTHQGGGAHPI